MFRCKNCGNLFKKTKKLLFEDFYGVYSDFGNSYGNTIDVCPECNDSDIEEYDEEEEKDIHDLVYDYLVENHIGKENLIKNQELRKIFGISSEKTMRKIIQDIRENEYYPLLVGSVSGNTGGFYICETEAEEEETINNLKHRANQMLRMTHIMEWKRGL